MFIVSKLKRRISSYRNRNQYVLRSVPETPAQANKVNINAWYDPDSEQNNLGDYISPIIVEYMAKQAGIDVQKSVRKTKFLSAVGSILFFTGNDRTVWGSGIMSFGCSGRLRRVKHMLNYKLFQNIDVRLVRGPETKRILDSLHIACPARYGDPALLMPEIYQPVISEKSDYIVCPHFTEQERYAKDHPTVSMLTNDWQETLNRLCSAKLVISSSLHGIILAEAYGIPAILLKTANQDVFKYNDYYYSTERYRYPVAESVEQALAMTPSIPSPRVLEKLRNDIRRTFPKDLWEPTA